MNLEIIKRIYNKRVTYIWGIYMLLFWFIHIGKIFMKKIVINL